MTTIELRSKVDSNGVLHVCVPFGKYDADREVRVTIEPLGETVKTMSPDQWRQFVHEMAGCIDDPTFQRHAQGDFENRKDLFP
ncbi:MAG: hypothetical protein EA424_00955 [Planctomycetaceae bacterium]|nr:MAG: hypothetical protein EA424_00955 [Planctomycetaceae bacterium]